MNTTEDKLIEYYFQRKINGMQESEIQKSLGEQFMEDGERELIFKQVQFKEMVYQKMLARKRQAKSTMLVGLGLILAGFIVFLITLINRPFPYYTHILYSLLVLGFAVFLGGIVISKR